ncbi:hypothetical protein DL769_002968 [Monosporascus sp. CRB-8-3]|nr:hypothetical protein DL769_002968 [Monosporascus sp. CRB-8-3]
MDLGHPTESRPCATESSISEGVLLTTSSATTARRPGSLPPNTTTMTTAPGNSGSDLRRLRYGVDWRSTVHEEPVRRARESIDSPEYVRLPGSLRAHLKALTCEDWATFVQQWRDNYAVFTKVATAVGIRRLGTRLVTATLSNGNQALLKDLKEHGGLDFQRVISSADFGPYQPNPYLGAVCALDLEPHEVAMVAARLYDLEGARANGLRTIYVERALEEAWEPEEDRYREARSWADVWVGEKDEGFVEVARELATSYMTLLIVDGEYGRTSRLPKPGTYDMTLQKPMTAAADFERRTLQLGHSKASYESCGSVLD